MKSKILATVVLLSMTAWVTGCGLTHQQKAGVLTFSAATRDFAAVAEEELVRSRVDVIDMNGLRVKLGDPAADRDKLDSFFTLEQVGVRLHAVTALKEYSALLAALVTSSQTEELKAASDKFVESLRKVKGVSLDDEKAGAVGKAVILVGGLLVEHQRANAIRQVVESANPHLTKVFDLVERDFDPKEDHWSLGYEGTVEFLEGAAKRVKNLEANDLAGNAVVQEARILAATNKKRFLAVAQHMTRSIETLRSAQGELWSLLHPDEAPIPNINIYAAQVEDLVQVYKVLRSDK